MRFTAIPRSAIGLLLVFWSGLVGAQARDFSGVEVTTTKLTDTIYMLQGAGGNIGASVGADGIFLIDDQFAPLSSRILKALEKLSDLPIRFVVNTHWHGDHTGGNDNMAKAGATIVAHDNVRIRMSSPQSMPAFDREVPASPESALPEITFSDTATFHLNGEVAKIIHVDNAHTDGDAFILFESANVIHTGDLVFNGFYPFIDVWSGGSIEGVISAVDVLLQTADKDTQIIPGHGPLARRGDLVRYREMLSTVREAVSKAISQGQSAKALVDSGALAEVERDWGGGFLDTLRFVSIVMTGMKGG